MDADRDPVSAAAFNLHLDLTGQVTAGADMLPTKLDLCSNIRKARSLPYRAVRGCTRSPDELHPTLRGQPPTPPTSVHASHSQVRSPSSGRH